MVSNLDCSGLHSYCTWDSLPHDDGTSSRIVSGPSKKKWRKCWARTEDYEQSVRKSRFLLIHSLFLFPSPFDCTLGRVPRIRGRWLLMHRVNEVFLDSPLLRNWSLKRPMTSSDVWFRGGEWRWHDQTVALLCFHSILLSFSLRNLFLHLYFQVYSRPCLVKCFLFNSFRLKWF